MQFGVKPLEIPEDEFGSDFEEKKIAPNPTVKKKKKKCLLVYAQNKRPLFCPVAKFVAQSTSIPEDDEVVMFKQTKLDSFLEENTILFEQGSP